MAAGREASPKDVASTERLREYWAHGEGAAKIQPEAPGAFTRCLVEVQKAVTDDGGKPLSDRMLRGFCARVIHEATGLHPGSDAYNVSHGHGYRGKRIGPG